MSHRHHLHHVHHHIRERANEPALMVSVDHPDATAAEPASIVRRAETSTSTSTTSQGSNLVNTLPVVLGVVIPVVCAAVVFWFLHRRYVRRLHYEDTHDKHKSLDFGMEVVRNGGDLAPEMGEKPHKRGGLSLDIGSNPYLLPPGLHNSKESLRSLSRVMSPDDDKYRLAAHSDAGSLRSYRTQPKWGDDASSFAASSRRAPTMPDEMDHGLLQNASGMSRSTPIDSPSPLGALPSLDEKHSNEPKSMGDSPSYQEPSDGPDEDFPKSFEASQHANEFMPEILEDHLPHQTTQSNLGDFDFGTANGGGGTFNEHHGIPTIEEPPKEPPTNSHPTGLPRLSLPMSETSDYGDDPEPKFGHLPPSINVPEPEEPPRESEDVHPPPNNRVTQTFTRFDEGFDPHRLTVGIRPLPPEDPSDNAEQRANRIRSFYKEYFDGGNDHEEYYEEYGPEAFEDAAVYDPYTGDFLTGPQKPFAQPMGRRAMTPPPRFQGPPRPFVHSSADMRAPGPRAFSSASARRPPNSTPRKPTAPPEPLHVLPSPSLIKDDMSILPVDYAPPTSFKGRQEGRPESPYGGVRPYTPTARAHTPLVSSFDDLAAIPSPHAMRKSGIYTTLDFAPPARFKNDTGSDAGSIRSNRSGISAVHTHNIRTGAYRVSRLPTNVVGTRDDLFASLRPNMDLNR